MSDIITLPPIKTPGILPLVRPFPRPIIHDKSLVAYWVFDREGKLMDLSGKGNHGTISGATWTAEGRYGSALDFDAIDNFVNCGLAPSCDFTTELFTMTFWLKVSVSGIKGLLEKRSAGNGYGLYHTGAYWTLETTNAGGTSILESNGYTIGAWEHVVFIKDSANTGKIYRNGVDDTRSGGTRNMVSPVGSNLNLGKYGPFYHAGLMDSMMIFKKALSPMEVKDLYESGL